MEWSKKTENVVFGVWGERKQWESTDDVFIVSGTPLEVTQSYLWIKQRLSQRREHLPVAPPFFSSGLPCLFCSETSVPWHPNQAPPRARAGEMRARSRGRRQKIKVEDEGEGAPRSGFWLEQRPVCEPPQFKTHMVKTTGDKLEWKSE